MTRPTVSDKRAAFREMHRAGCFLLPNPWDAGSARLLERLGYRALATTSAGYAWSQGQADGQLSRDDTLAHMRYMAAMSDLPINADFESGFGATPEAVFDSVSLALATGVAGLSIEDSSGDPNQPVRDKAQAVERLQAARACRRRAPLSMPAAATPCWWGVRRIISSAAPTWTTRSSACSPIRRPGPTACTRRGSGRGRKFRRSSRPSRRSR